ncbi:PadR family transcriptional regulator [Isobaculum melis]|uniref:Transcriptional regulator PadR-like family protein n=1 Tax=Isobaculum melis TaxID=142588 RepID=A0A1H9TLS4_9LACT|nr:PadR family transcriptional regulator [Isobaculum melis]SER97573.1 Transcriptional regulator PadR-like family protein [Isobaculum melis]
MTRLIVLGLLDEQPMSGYDIQQKIRHADAERWGGVLVGSIYHALKKLEQENHIELSDVRQTGNRQKSIYQITNQGRAYLNLLILDSLHTKSVIYPTRLYSGISLLGKVPTKDAQQALLQQKDLLNQEYQSLKRGNEKNINEKIEVPPLSKLTIDNLFAILQLQQQFIDEILKTLE